MLLPADFREFIALMIHERVKFVMIGGYAYNLYRNPRATGDLDGLDIPVISPETLLKNKQASGRAKDLADAAELRQLLTND